MNGFSSSSILVLITFLSVYHQAFGQPDSSVGFFDDDEEEMEPFWRRDSSGSSSSSEEHHRRPPQIQIFVPPRQPPRPAPQPQSEPEPQPEPEPSTTANPLLDTLVAPADLTEEEKAARRQAYVQFLGDLEDAKNQLEGLEGRWGSRITENLVYLAEQQLQKLNGDAQGTQDPNQIFLGDGPLDLRQIQQGQQTAQREDELQQVARFGLDELGVSEGIGSQSRKKRQSGSGVTCQEFVFDSRQKWPQCASIINNVRDQSLCGDCWAVSASSSFTDRRCIQKVKRGQPIGGQEEFFSAYDTAICSDAVTDQKDGCNGGSSAMAWRWYANTGVVSGGNNAAQNTSSGPQGGCKPYPFLPTAIADEPIYEALQTQCFATCSSDGTSSNSNNPPRAKAMSWNYLYGSNGWEEVMRNEIFQNGSISASLMVFEDFKTYSGGIYSQVTGKQLGGHAIRLIGYGNISCSDGSSMKYWLGVNSWNTAWGLNGLFKIARGVDMCGIESRQISYGIPVV